MDTTADELLRSFETCYAYNESFKYYYKISMPRRECEKYVDRMNECKGGRWQVRRKIDWQQHFELLKDVVCENDGSCFL